MSFFVKSALIAEVAGHAFMIGMGPDRCSQSGRQPFKQDGGNPDDHTLVHNLSGTDGGRYGLQAVRCVSTHNDDAVEKLANWCKDAQGINKAAYKTATADQAMCYGATPNTFTWNQNGPNSGAPNGFPTLGYGKDQSCDWQANDTIKVAVQVTAQHWGTHYVDMIPQNKKQVDILPKCEFTKNRIKDFKPCVQPNVIPENTHNGELEEWQRSTIRLHPAFGMHWTEEEASKDPTYNMKFFDTSSETPGQPSSDSSYRIEYQFPMPALGEHFFEKDTPAVFRWVWFCGWDVETNCSADNSCKGQITHPGMGEIFITCADISSVANCKGSDCQKPKPRPTTTSGPVTTSNNTTTAPGPAPKPDANCKYVGNWNDGKNKDVGSSTSQAYADWCAAATKGNASRIANFTKGAYAAYGCCAVGAGPGPQPETTTDAPTTTHDSTTGPASTGPATTAGPLPEGDRCVGEPFANTCKGRCQTYCNNKYGAVERNQCWGYQEGVAGSEFILCVCGGDGEKDGPVVLPGCECHRKGGCKEDTMLLL